MRMEREVRGEAAVTGVEARLQALEARVAGLEREVQALRLGTPWAGEDSHPTADADCFVRDIVVDGGDAFFGANWHGAERGAEGPLRWSGPGMLATIVLKLDRRVALTLDMQGIVFADGVEPWLSVFADGTELREGEVTGGTVSLHLDPEPGRARPTELGFLTGPTVRPDGEGRWIGFSFRRLLIAPARPGQPG